ncbi:MAG: hypothetical protein A3A88_09435 [Nitrospirae bacterium RIFCSPLOWO2_01_FULL_62_17]|nr:MAG: hypothetical protein A3A88_09435 [Nitrospirae bacterium RIFCSPLOWO2_01_FULL_62_17]
MPPPDLPGNAPVFDVPHPAEIIIRPTFRDDADPPVLDGFDGRLCQRFDFDEPLRGQIRLDDGLAAVALPKRHLVIFRFDQQVARLQDLLDFQPGLADGQVLNLACDGFVDRGGLEALGVELRKVVEDRQARQLVAFARFEVVEVVRRGDLDRAGAEFKIHQYRIADDRNLATGERQPDLFAYEMAVTGILRMHGHGRVAQHRLGPRRGDGQ